MVILRNLGVEKAWMEYVLWCLYLWLNATSWIWKSVGAVMGRMWLSGSASRRVRFILNRAAEQ